MKRSKLLRSTPFRLALTFSCLFIVAYLIAGIVVFELVRADLAKRLDETVQATYAAAAATYADGELEDLIEAVKSQSSLSTGGEKLFELLNTSGRHLAGNVEIPSIQPGFTTIPEGTLPSEPKQAYRALSGLVGGNTMTVAYSVSETEAVERLMLLGFGWGSVITSVLAVLGGVLLASGIQRRLDSIGVTMTDVSHGRLEARIPLMGRGDDIDEMSGQVNAALDRLAALVKGMKHVSANIAHDLKAPLGRLQIVLETAIGKSPEGSSVSGDLMQAREECAQVNSIFEALLRIAQIEAGARRARFSDLAPVGIVRDIAEAYTDVVAEAGMILSVKTICSEESRIFGDRQLLLQLCSNLIENAIRHCPAGTRIDLHLRAEGRGIDLIVADNGPGIPVSERSSVLDPLYRLEKSRTTPGNGLGLSLVKAIADLHGATLRLDDNHPGLRVTVAFARL